MIEKRTTPSTGILQDWVAKLGLRYQGVLVSVIRGCDTVPKEDPSKDLTRAIRGVLLNTHCENPDDAKSFIEQCSIEETRKRTNSLLGNMDHYPHHFVMHLIHACQVIGHFHPDKQLGTVYLIFYTKCCKSLHLGYETFEDMRERLEANEEEFSKDQSEHVG